MTKVFHWKLNKVIKEVAAQTNVSIDDVKDVLWSEFKTLSDLIGNYESMEQKQMRLPYFGLFLPKKMFLERKLYLYKNKKIRISNKLLHIIEGWKNVIFPNEKAEQMAKARASVCAACPFNVNNTCSKCNCPLSAKTRATGDNCPIGKW